MVDDLQNSTSVTFNFNREVQQVNYSNGAVIIKAKNLETGEIEEYSGDKAVSTVSIGVLKNKVIEFNPPLPAWKTKMIDDYQMVTLTKIMVAYETQFWPKTNYFGIATDRKGYYCGWKNWGKSEKHFILQGYVVGDEALRVEGLTEE